MMAAILRRKRIEIPLGAVDGDLLDVVDQRYIPGFQSGITAQREDMFATGYTEKMFVL